MPGRGTCTADSDDVMVSKLVYYEIFCHLIEYNIIILIGKKKSITESTRALGFDMEMSPITQKTFSQCLFF